MYFRKVKLASTQLSFHSCDTLFESLSKPILGSMHKIDDLGQ